MKLLTILPHLINYVRALLGQDSNLQDFQFTTITFTSNLHKGKSFENVNNYSLQMSSFKLQKLLYSLF